MHLIDTHTHLDFPDFAADRSAVLARSRALGVQQMVVLGVYQGNWQRLWDLVQSQDGLYAAIGLHPVYLQQHRPEHLHQLRDWLQTHAGNPKLCAVGEIGLDGEWTNLIGLAGVVAGHHMPMPETFDQSNAEN